MSGRNIYDKNLAEYVNDILEEPDSSVGDRPELDDVMDENYVRPSGGDRPRLDYVMDENDGGGDRPRLDYVMDENDGSGGDRPRLDDEIDENDGSGGDTPRLDDEIDEDDHYSDEEPKDLFGYDSDAGVHIASEDSDGSSDEDEVGQPNTQGNQGQNVPDDLLGLTWGPADERNLFSFQVNNVPVLTNELLEKIQGASPFEVFQLFVDDDLFLEIANQTNLYAEQ